MKNKDNYNPKFDYRNYDFCEYYKVDGMIINQKEMWENQRKKIDQKLSERDFFDLYKWVIPGCFGSGISLNLRKKLVLYIFEHGYDVNYIPTLEEIKLRHNETPQMNILQYFYYDMYQNKWFRADEYLVQFANFFVDACIYYGIDVNAITKDGQSCLMMEGRNGVRDNSLFQSFEGPERQEKELEVLRLLRHHQIESLLRAGSYPYSINTDTGAIKIVERIIDVILKIDPDFECLIKEKYPHAWVEYEQLKQ